MKKGFIVVAQGTVLEGEYKMDVAVDVYTDIQYAIADEGQKVYEVTYDTVQSTLYDRVFTNKINVVGLYVPEVISGYIVDETGMYKLGLTINKGFRGMRLYSSEELAAEQVDREYGSIYEVECVSTYEFKGNTHTNNFKVIEELAPSRKEQFGYIAVWDGFSIEVGQPINLPIPLTVYDSESEIVLDKDHTIFKVKFDRKVYGNKVNKCTIVPNEIVVKPLTGYILVSKNDTLVVGKEYDLAFGAQVSTTYLSVPFVPECSVITVEYTKFVGDRFGTTHIVSKFKIVGEANIC